MLYRLDTVLSDVMPLTVLQVPTNFTWVCSSQRFYHPKFMQSFARHGLEVLANPTTAPLFDDMSIAITLHGFASHTIEADDAVCWAFIKALAHRAVQTLEEFRPQVGQLSALDLWPLALGSLLASSCWCCFVWLKVLLSRAFWV